MLEFSTYCTEEQTKKAFELGAPIEVLPNYIEFEKFPFINDKDGNQRPCMMPTAEQMIGWLEEPENVEIFIEKIGKNWGFDIYDNKGQNITNSIEDFPSRKEATLAAIDAALDYLIKNKHT